MTIGIILSGSPYSVYDEDAPRVDPAVFDFGVPVFGICYGLQVRARAFFSDSDERRSYLLLPSFLFAFPIATFRWDPKLVSYELVSGGGD
jgi:hypothetical protein